MYSTPPPSFLTLADRSCEPPRTSTEQLPLATANFTWLSWRVRLRTVDVHAPSPRDRVRRVQRAVLVQGQHLHLAPHRQQARRPVLEQPTPVVADHLVHLPVDLVRLAPHPCVVLHRRGHVPFLLPQDAHDLAERRDALRNQSLREDAAEAVVVDETAEDAGLLGLDQFDPQQELVVASVGQPLSASPPGSRWRTGRGGRGASRGRGRSGGPASGRRPAPPHRRRRGAARGCRPPGGRGRRCRRDGRHVGRDGFVGLPALSHDIGLGHDCAWRLPRRAADGG